MKIRIRRSGDNVEKTFGIDKNGHRDFDEIDAFRQGEKAYLVGIYGDDGEPILQMETMAEQPLWVEEETTEFLKEKTTNEQIRHRSIA